MSGRGGRGSARGRGRGRGRGGSRGRGASRGRSGSRGGGTARGSRGSRGTRGRGASSRGRGAFNAGTNCSEVDEWGVEKQEKDETLDIKKDLKKFFVGTASFDQHYDAQEENVLRYVAGMAVLEKNGVEISTNARVRALAAAWARKDHKLAECLLTNSETFGLVEVLKAVTLLDSSRRIREEEKRLKKLQIQNGGKIKPRVMGKVKSNIDNLTAIKPKCGSASGAVCKHIRRWVRKFTKSELEFYALHFPNDPWRRLADMCHFHPQKDFPELQWFLPFCFGEEAPEGSMVRMCRDMNPENVNDLLKEFPIPYSHIKKSNSDLTEESKGRIAAKDKLDQIIWYYEDLQCGEVDDIIKYRLTQGEKVTLPYGKLMERLLTIKMIREEIPTKSRSYGCMEVARNKNPTKAKFFDLLLPRAQSQLSNIKLTLDSPVVVVGDRSGSMEVAIRTSTIIASLLTAICGARLVFFDHENMDAPFIPTNITEVLEMAVTIETRGSTAPAASLWPFYQRKELIKTFILVTDEEENGSYEGHKFAPLYKKYLEEVNPDCRLVFVSFLRTQHQTGQMVDALRAQGITKNVMQFKFDQTRPDLTKLDKLFGLLSAETEDFETEVRNMEESMGVDGIAEIFSKLQEKDSDHGEKSGPTGSGDVVDPNATSVSVTDSVMGASSLGDIEVINLEDAVGDVSDQVEKCDKQTTVPPANVMAQSVDDWQVVDNAWGQSTQGVEDWS